MKNSTKLCFNDLSYTSTDGKQYKLLIPLTGHADTEQCFSSNHMLPQLLLEL